MSAASVSRTGLPFSQLSATASISRFSSIASAILFRTRERSVVDDSAQASFAACAASSASSTSSEVERGTSVNGFARRGRQVVRVRALRRRDPLAADEVLVARLQLDGTVDLARGREGRGPFDGCHDVSFLEGLYGSPSRSQPMHASASGETRAADPRIHRPRTEARGTPKSVAPDRTLRGVCRFAGNAEPGSKTPSCMAQRGSRPTHSTTAPLSTQVCANVVLKGSSRSRCDRPTARGNGGGSRSRTRRTGVAIRKRPQCRTAAPQ